MAFLILTNNRFIILANSGLLKLATNSLFWNIGKQPILSCAFDPIYGNL